MDKLNPQIKTVEIGTRGLRKVNVYPLSYGDQRKLIDTIRDKVSDTLRTVSGENSLEIVTDSNSESNEGVDLVSLVFEALQDNFDYILELVTDGDVTVNELTNYQVSEVIRIVYEVNFEEPGKNLPSLFQKGIQSLWKRLSHAYLNDMDTE
ncbi:MAG: hypothetical protein ACOC80_10995 [Petrotogales bacterium]